MGSCLSRVKETLVDNMEIGNADSRSTSASSVHPEVMEEGRHAAHNHKHAVPKATDVHEEHEGMKDVKIAELSQKLERIKARSKADIGMRDGQIAELKQDIIRIQAEKEELLLRLSSMAGAKLTDNNPNITDLSDENRPTKLAEQYTQLYDNEWTDAFVVLTEICKISDQDAICILRDSFLETYKICTRWATEKLDNVRVALTEFEGVKEPYQEIMKKLKENRKNNYKKHLKELKKMNTDALKEIVSRANLKKYGTTKEQRKTFNTFLTKSRQIAWLMAIQDPPVVVDCEVEKEEQAFDKNLYKEYTKSGSKIMFVVWPILYLHEGGPMLTKGIAQGKNRKRDVAVVTVENEVEPKKAKRPKTDKSATSESPTSQSRINASQDGSMTNPYQESQENKRQLDAYSKAEDSNTVISDMSEQGTDSEHADVSAKPERITRSSTKHDKT